jgi:hypothetical protein
VLVVLGGGVRLRGDRLLDLPAFLASRHVPRPVVVVLLRRFPGLFGLVHHGDDDDDRKRRRRRREQRAEDLPLVAPAMTATRVNT